MAAFTLPKIKAADSIVDGDGKPTIKFLKFFNFDFARAIERNDAAQSETIAAIQVIVNQLQTAAEATQQAQNAANQAQQTADNASGSGAISGSSTNPDVDLIGTGWVSGPTVNLSGVAAGDLTITGSGPLQDANVTLAAPGRLPPLTVTGYYRIVEVVGGVDEILFSGVFTVALLEEGGAASVTNSSVSAVASFVSSRTSTGSVSYRIDAKNRSSTIDVANLSLYLFVRRAV